MALTVMIENPHSETSLRLITELSLDLGATYGTDGTAGFNPHHVSVPRAAFVVAWLDEEPVGCGALRPTEDENVGEIKRMYVRRASRGQGISRHILNTLEQIAIGHYYTHLILETGTRQLEAIGLYHAMDYHPIPCYGEYVNSPISICFGKTLLG